MAETAIDAKGTAPLTPDLLRVAAIKDKADIPAVVGHMHTVGMSGFFGFGAAPDFKDATQYMLIFGQGGLGLPDRDYYLKDDADAAKLRAEYEQHVRRMLQLGGDTPAAAAAGAKKVLEIETTLAKNALDRVSQRNPTNIYHKMSRDDVKKLMPNFNMSQYLERAEAPPGDSANVTEPEFLKAVDQVIVSTPLPDLKTYLRWHVIRSNASMLPKPFVDESFAFYGKTLTGAKEQRPRWKRCVDATDSDLGEALGKIYVERTFGAEGKARTLADGRGDRGGARHRHQGDHLDVGRDQEGGGGQAARRRQQDRLSRSLARLLVTPDRPRRRLRQFAARQRLRLPAARWPRSASPSTRRNG